MHPRDLKMLSMQPGSVIYYATNEGIIKREQMMLDPNSLEYKQLASIASDRDPALPIAAELAFINYTGHDLNKRCYHFRDTLTNKKYVYATDEDDYRNSRETTSEEIMDPDKIFFQRERCMEHCRESSGVNKETIDEFIHVLDEAKEQVKAIENVYKTVTDNTQKYRIITEILSAESLPEKYRCYI